MAKKDFGKYFNQPSLKDAKKRGKESVEVLTEAFYIPERMKEVGHNKTYYIRTYGCQMNVHDTEVMQGILGEMGYTEAAEPKDADIILLNTCAVRENAEDKVFGAIGNLKHLKKDNPDILLGVCGCMSQEENVVDRILKKYPHIDMIFGTHNIHRIPQILEEAMFSKAKVVDVWSKEGDVIENLPKRRDSKTKAWVNITYGCDKFCTYCIIPFTRGKERSRLKEDILAEIQTLIDEGYQEVTVLGQNVNSYGKDVYDDYTFAQLLADVQKMPIARVRFTTSHPWDFTQEMVEVLKKGGNMMPHVHLPVQSGSSSMLKIMGRSYTRETYLALYDQLRAIPGVAITTDIIVGFPNETDEQFEETVSLVDTCEYDGAYTFIYSPREGTPAAKMVDNVPEDVKKERLQRLNTIVNTHAKLRNDAYLGKIVHVLVDGPSQKRDDILAGYSESWKLVNFKGTSDMIGKIVPVKITDVRTWSLVGEVVE
ncbi:MAG: tRNA (N6-isopentenyl adenosine(37)-C2)-methylthiotransferase MiaB [Culicoidibacterales bacterium]